ncbi:hypothetical protein NP233_g1353 [Leucocoprinus birnbaumii]|uniref:FAD dependent oxidoreductase domain-containing protein n=1 Tax=Leucocoprinus birnbaumii TaxID=56174 RepID=A0AAD5YVX6_9AGAR|nr:hypothetical protein NP233_g1353 [Leucocoprinus birnbaumii]
MRKYTDITVLDRSSILPAPDASSNDINRSLVFVLQWRTISIGYLLVLDRLDGLVYSSLLLGPFCPHPRSGVVVLDNDGSAAPAAGEPHEDEKGRDHDFASANGSTYASESFLNDLKLGCSLVPLPDPATIRSVFPAGIPVGSFEGNGTRTLRQGYLNRDGGWADAGQGVNILLSRVRQLGAKVHPGKAVSSLQHDNGRVIAVRCTDDSVYDVDLLVIATGSWSPSAFPDLRLQDACLATGQCVAMIQLTEEEAERYQDIPVVLNFSTGFYAFPPTAKNVFKIAVHAPGFTHFTPNSRISTPRTITTDPDNGSAIPKHILQGLRNGLREVFPDLAKKPFSATRLCWYNDSPDGDWIISKHPALQNLILATGGSGHAYKFLPVIGRLVADLIEGSLEPNLVEKFAVNRVHGRVDGSRSGAPTELDLNQLCSPRDLLAPNLP